MLRVFSSYVRYSSSWRDHQLRDGHDAIGLGAYQIGPLGHPLV